MAKNKNSTSYLTSCPIGTSIIIEKLEVERITVEDKVKNFNFEPIQWSLNSLHSGI